MAWINAARTRSEGEELSAPAPAPQVLGSINHDDIARIIADEAGPPPWQAAPGAAEGDARAFVEVPENWVLRWLNPRLVDLLGWRDWRPVMASDPRVTVRVRAAVDLGNNIRRGGHQGDLLAYMPRHWYEAKVAQQRAFNDRATTAAVERQERLKEEFARGTYGPNVSLDSARHPTHTIADGRTMRD